jgi:hypothetical protein
MSLMLLGITDYVNKKVQGRKKNLRKRKENVSLGQVSPVI